MSRWIFALLFATTSLHAQVVATSGRDIVVAHDRRVELFEPNARRVWTAEGVANPSRIASGRTRVAVIDAFANELVVIDKMSGRAERIITGETPIDAVFIGDDLFVLDRDARRLEKLKSSSLTVAEDPAFLRAANNLLYVYSRLDGLVQEIDPGTMRITRTVALPPFASDFDLDRRTGYLVYPHDARLRTFSLAAMKRTGDIDAGVVPVDLTITSRENALSASRLAIADPSAKRVWIIEGEQSVTRAVTRGFLRGLLGLGLFAPKSSDFPTGVDRVTARGSNTVAYDSTTGTLYRVKGKHPAVLARGLRSSAFALTDDAVVVWESGALRLIR